MRTAGSIVAFGLVVSAVAATAVGGVEVVTEYGTTPGGLDMVTVRLVADTPAERVSAFDGGFSADTGFLHQVWIGPRYSATPTLDGLDPASNEAEDSHLLFFDAELVPIDGADEDNDLSGGAGAGCGTCLTGVFAIQPSAQAQDLPLAQIVFSPTFPGEILYDFEVSDGQGVKTTLAGRLPEPAALGLMAVGAAWVVASRFRRRYAARKG
jgi:hypothetical protein